MNRCCICDYTQELGSPIMDKEPTGRCRVRYSEKHSGFYCTDCLGEIENNLSELTIEDNLNPR